MISVGFSSNLPLTLSLAISNKSTTPSLKSLSLSYSLEERYEHIITGHSPTTGRSKNLRITIRKYEPSVDCDPNPSLAPSEESCDAVIALVPSYPKVLSFVFTRDWGIGFGKLPRRFYISEYLRLVYLRSARPEAPPARSFPSPLFISIYCLVRCPISASSGR